MLAHRAIVRVLCIPLLTPLGRGWSRPWGATLSALLALCVMSHEGWRRSPPGNASTLLFARRLFLQDFLLQDFRVPTAGEIAYCALIDWNLGGEQVLLHTRWRCAGGILETL